MVYFFKITPNTNKQHPPPKKPTQFYQKTNRFYYKKSPQKTKKFLKKSPQKNLSNLSKNNTQGDKNKDIIF
jgi:hypothetical protein